MPVAGKSPQQVEAEIVRRLNGKANQPQVLVRVTRNATSNVTVVGEVGQSLRMPLTAKGRTAAGCDRRGGWGAAAGRQDDGAGDARPGGPRHGTR